MKQLIGKINKARFDIFIRDPYFGYLLQHTNIEIENSSKTAYTNGKKIVFGKDFLVKLSHTETMFILVHELLHIVLGHISRRKNYESKRRSTKFTNGLY